MKKRNTGHSPNFANANRIRFDDDLSDAVVDTIVQLLVEGYPDGFTVAGRAKPVERQVRKEAA